MPFSIEFSIFIPFWTFLFSEVSDLVKIGRSCSGLFSPKLFQRLEGRFPSKLLLRHSEIIAKLCASVFRPCERSLEPTEGKYSFCRF